MIKLLTALALVVSTIPAAADVQFRDGLNPAFNDLGLVLAARRVVVGLSQDSLALVHLSAVAAVQAQCVNPTSENAKPTKGEPEDIVVGGQQVIPRGQISEKGRALMLVITALPPLEVAGAPDCNGKDVEVITNLSFRRAVITIDQPVDSQVLRTRCVFVPSTLNGPVSGASVTCTKP